MVAMGGVDQIRCKWLVSVAEHYQLIKELAAAEVQRLADLRAIPGR